MVERYKDPVMQQVVRRTIRAAMAAESVTYQELTDRLMSVGVDQTPSTLRTKVATGVMTTSLFIHILSVLSVSELSIQDLVSKYQQMKTGASAITSGLGVDSLG